MKKLILTSLLTFASMGFLFAGDCEDKDYANFNKTKPEIVLTLKNLQLLKYSDKKGNTRFTIQYLDGTILAENISRSELRIDFPEIENKLES
tara:strand:+ start:2673 stop:2948 length:276 start_codon:yes stop_codon:yes gene_type:complete